MLRKEITMSRNKKWKRRAKRSLGECIRIRIHKGKQQCPMCSYVFRCECCSFDGDCNRFKLVGIRQLEKEFKCE